MQRFTNLSIEDTIDDDDLFIARPASSARHYSSAASQDHLNLYDYARVGSQPFGSQQFGSLQHLSLDQNLTYSKVSLDSATEYEPIVQPAVYQQGLYLGTIPGKEEDKRYIFGSRVSLAISIISALLVVGLEGFMYGVINVHRHEFPSDSRYMEMSIFLALFIFAGVYQVVVTIIAQHTKNMLLFSLLCLFYATMVVYTGIQYDEMASNLNMMDSAAWRAAAKGTNIAAIGVLGITFVLQVVMIYFVLNRSVQWFKFKKIGASIAIKRMYTVFQIHRSLLIFDFFFFLGFTVQFIVIMVSDKTSKEFILTCCMLPLTLVVLFLADFAATRELLWLSVVTLCCLCGGVVYVLFKTIRLFTKYTSAYNVDLERGAYFPGRTSMVMFAAITLFFLLVTMAFEAWLVWNYNNGLLLSVNTYYSRLPLSGQKLDENEKTDAESVLID